MKLTVCIIRVDEHSKAVLLIENRIEKKIDHGTKAGIIVTILFFFFYISIFTSLNKQSFRYHVDMLFKYLIRFDFNPVFIL